MRVLIIGGYGGFGGRLSRRLSAAGYQVIVGGRNGAKASRFCEGLANSEPVVVDRTADLHRVLAALRPDLVIDAAGPFQDCDYRVPRTCIELGVSYLDLADARQFVTDIGNLDAPARKMGVTIIAGASTLPALSAAVARYLADGLERVDQVRIALSASTASTANASVVRAILSYVGKRFRRWSAGRWSDAYGWQGLVRQEYEIDGTRPLTRWVALADVPDLQILPAFLPGNPGVEFRAGTDVAYHMAFLWLASWLVRWRLIRSLAPMSRALLELQRVTAFGRGDRSAMRVSLKGLCDGMGVERDWTLIAERFDGPEIPTLAAALLADNFAHGRLPPGARDAAGLLPLERFDELFESLAVTSGVTEQPCPSLYQRVMSDRFWDLPDAVRAMHSIHGEGGAQGEGTVATGASLVARILCKVMKFPPAGTYPVHVSFLERNGGEKWIRRFGDHRFSSVLRKSGSHVTERFGPLRFRFELRTDGKKLVMQPRGWDVLGVPLPMIIGPRIDASEREEGGLFHFDVAVALPLIGPVIEYRGSLQWIGSEHRAPDSKRAARKLRTALA